MTRLDLTEEIIVLVGKDDQQKKWTVHKTFLTRTSELFQKCCSSGWKEAKERTVELPETDPDNFATYLQWLYTRELVATETPDLHELKTEDRQVRAEAASAIFATLIALGTLADMLMDSAFENAVVDEIIKTKEATEKVPSPAKINIIYANVPRNCNIKRLIVDYYASEVNTNFLIEERDYLHEDVIFDIMVRLHKDRKESAENGFDRLRPTWERRCDYHTHNDEVPIC